MISRVNYCLMKTTNHMSYERAFTEKRSMICIKLQSLIRAYIEVCKVIWVCNIESTQRHNPNAVHGEQKYRKRGR